MDTINVMDPALKPGIDTSMDIINKIATYSPILGLLLLLLIAAIYLLVRAYLKKDRKVEELNKALVLATSEDIKLVTELKFTLEKFSEIGKTNGDNIKEMHSILQKHDSSLDRVMLRIESMMELLKDKQ